jgi:hypothetical protein
LVSWVRGGLVRGEEDELPAVLTAFDLLRGKRIKSKMRKQMNQRLKLRLKLGIE